MPLCNPLREWRVDRAAIRHAGRLRHADACGGTIFPWLARVAFGGPDLRIVSLGGLRAASIPVFDGPAAGLPMVHWNEAAAAAPQA